MNIFQKILNFFVPRYYYAAFVVEDHVGDFFSGMFFTKDEAIVHCAKCWEQKQADHAATKENLQNWQAWNDDWDNNLVRDEMYIQMYDMREAKLLDSKWDQYGRIIWPQ